MRALIALVLLTGCAAAPARVATRAELGAWTASERAAPEATTVRRERFETVRVASAPPAETLPFSRRGPRIDVRLERARLSNALRFLAEQANLGIVIGDGLDQEISADLRRVRPVEAMQALAEAHHVELRIIGRTVIAQRRNGS